MVYDKTGDEYFVSGLRSFFDAAISRQFCHNTLRYVIMTDDAPHAAMMGAICDR